MPNPAERSPSRAEVLHYAARLRDSPYFNAAKTQATMLMAIIEMTLEGNAMNEMELGLKLVDNFDPDSHIIRATASIIRKKLAAYYAKEGENDIVRIGLPAGPPYACEFTYNSRSGILVIFQRASRLLDRFDAHSVHTARCMLSEIIHGEDNYVPEEERFAPAYALHAECSLLMYVSEQIFWNHCVVLGNHIVRKKDRSNDYVGRISNRLEQASEVDPTLILTELVAGGFALLFGRPDLATGRFEWAEQKDAAATRQSLWYALFLWLARDEPGAALSVIEDAIRLSPEASGPRYLGALVSYSAGDLAAAMSFAEDLEDFSAADDYPRILEGLIALAQSDYDTAARKFRLLEKLDFGRAPFPQTDVERLEREYFVGFTILCLCRQGKTEEAIRRFEGLKTRRNVSALDMCIASMAFDDIDGTLRWLAAAIQEGNVFAIWCARLPLFDRLKSKMTRQALDAFVKEKVYLLWCEENAPGT